MLEQVDIPTPDADVWIAEFSIAAVQHDSSVVTLTWSDDLQSRYHGIWLRDNCGCEACTHPSSREQRFELTELPEDLSVAEAGIGPEGALTITWSPDGHAGRFHPGWLRAHDYSNQGSPAPAKRITWNSEELATPPIFEGPDFLASDDIVYGCLESLWIYGVCLVRDLPDRPGTIEEVAARIGPPRETHWGRVFDVKLVPGAHSTAYTASSLPAHMDLPNLEVPPGIQILHCLKASVTGGESVMIDGCRIGEDLRVSDPEAFELLTTIRWPFMNRAGESGVGEIDVRWSTPHLILDEAGAVAETRLTHFSHAPLMAPFDKIEPSYRAVRRLVSLSQDPKYQMVIPLEPGLAVLFDNRRILHTRRHFDPTSGERHLQGIYLDRDTWLSRMRIIERCRRRSRLAGD